PAVTARVELYDKVLSDPHPRFENLYDRIIVFPELRADRTRVVPERSSARGVEVLLRHESQGPLSGWINFTHASVSDEIGGRGVPRAWDQRNAATFSVNYKIGEHWNFNLAGTWHTGWPMTPLVVTLDGTQLQSELGPLRSARLRAYRRADIRVSHRLVTSGGAFTFFVDIFNALNVSNVSSVNGFFVDQQSDGTLATRPIEDPVVGVIPSFGI